MTTESQSFDVYSNTQKLDEPIIDAVATRLEARGKHPIFQKMLHEYLDFMEIDDMKAVVDLGCGTGFVAREIAKRANFKGRVVAVDISSSLIEHASKMAEEEGISNRIDFRVGESCDIGLSDGSFDALIAHTLISHFPDPAKLIDEMRRLTKPGGQVVIFDGDFSSLTYSHPDVEKGKAIDELIIRSIVTQPRIMRQLPLLLKSAGLELVKTYAYVVTDVGKADYWESSVESLRKLLPAASAMTVEEADSWANNRISESEAGTFFASSNYYSYVARKPAAVAK